MIHINKFFWRSYLQKKSLQVTAILKHFYEFVLIFVFAPCKKKYSRGNNISFINISLKKAHMKGVG